MADVRVSALELERDADRRHLAAVLQRLTAHRELNATGTTATVANRTTTTLAAATTVYPTISSVQAELDADDEACRDHSRDPSTGLGRDDGQNASKPTATAALDNALDDNNSGSRDASFTVDRPELTTQQLNELVVRLGTVGHTSDRLDLVARVLQGRSLSCNQLGCILQALVYPKEKLHVAREARPRLSDRHNCQQALAASQGTDSVHLVRQLLDVLT
eukprot:m.106670 g.106670  ORF g.106670 m.106670 type:complete len:219 (+) comp15793_c0_seq1:1227-1883(+)